MLAGVLPFRDPMEKRLATKIINQEYQMHKCFSEIVKHLIYNILQVDTNNRFSIEHIKLHKWFNEVKPLNESEGIHIGQDPIPVIEEYTCKI